MSRTVEFDIEDTKNKIMETFWINGMKTTLGDVQISTGLSKSSIYNTFGNKDNLFALSMICYAEYLEEWVKKSFDKLMFKAFIKELLQDAVTNNFGGRGCFFYNCLGRQSRVSKKNKLILNSTYLRVRKIFEDRISLAKECNELDLNIDSTGFATLLMATIAGLRSFNLSGLPKKDLQNAALIAFDSFSLK